MKQLINSTKAPSAIGPYSQGILDSNSNTIYVSGQLPINKETSQMPDDIQNQTEQSLLNLKAVLEKAGSSLDKVVKTTVYLKDMNDFQKMNEIYSKYFNEPYPSRVAIEVSRLPKDAKVEIDAIAAH